MLTELTEDELRQYIDASSCFEALRRAQQEAALFRGGLIWRTQGRARYLVRTSITGRQKGLGRESAETTAIYEEFHARKSEAHERLCALKEHVCRMERLNKALRLGQVPTSVIKLLNSIDAAWALDDFHVASGYAMHAYEAAAGVRINSTTQDCAPLLDARQHAHVIAQLDVPAWNISSPRRFSQVVVATNGSMAMMHTVHPLDFVRIKQALAQADDRDPLERRRDLIQADVISELVERYLSHLCDADCSTARSLDQPWPWVCTP